MNPILLNPHIDGQTTQEQLQQMRSYLYQFKEQVELILSNIDVDNFSDNTNKILEKSVLTAGNYSSQITQLANQISLEVKRATGAESSISSSVNVLDGEVSLKVNSSDYTASVIVSKINNGSVTINANRIDLKGYVTISNLSGDETIIDGKTIKTGTIDADKIKSYSITTKELKAGCVTTSKILAGAITAEKIASKTITADQIDVDTIKLNKLFDASSSSELPAIKTIGDIITIGNKYTQYIEVDTIRSYFGSQSDPVINIGGNKAEAYWSSPSSINKHDYVLVGDIYE